jgi:hypothetical protein
VNCGLANKFYDTDWLPIYIRRGANLNTALTAQLKENLKNTPPQYQPQNLDSFDNQSIVTKIEQLYRAYYRPLFLIFDQFEELFILGSRDEAAAFYDSIRQILEESPIQAKIILIIREEWIAYLNDFEKVIPYLFENRLRVEKPDDRTLFRIVGGTLQAANIGIEQAAVTIRALLDNIRDRREGVDLTHLQVYLDRVYRKLSAEQTALIFTPSVIAEVGAMQNVISAFLDEQFGLLEQDLQKRGIAQAKGIPLEILFTMVSDDGTKKPVDLAHIQESLPRNIQIKIQDIEFCLNRFKTIRILRETE